ncbi:glycosyltransferase [Bradyrhizobium arachidis]|uniref:glycosyltransferase n=1 Tax=Bradyrhizobium arachidis TaxID=858423 RepID=UPI00216356E0|nr:glycosyltransferase [Bradyrhizobium arachidis]UVO39197.1 glycosyltransferase [Bradyrhizobium arachidis]
MDRLSTISAEADKSVWTAERVETFWAVSYARDLEASRWPSRAAKFIADLLIRRFPVSAKILLVGDRDSALAEALLNVGYSVARVDVGVWLRQPAGAALRGNWLGPISNVTEPLFDVVVSVGLAECLLQEEVEPFLDILRLAVLPGGHVVVAVHNDERLEQNEVACPKTGTVFHCGQRVRSYDRLSLCDFLSCADLKAVAALEVELEESIFEHYTKVDPEFANAAYAHIGAGTTLFAIAQSAAIPHRDAGALRRANEWLERRRKLAAVPKPSIESWKWDDTNVASFWSRIAGTALDDLSFGKVLGRVLLRGIEPWLVPGGRHLDMGAGEGHMAEILAASNYAVATLEPAQERARQLKAKLAHFPAYLGHIDRLDHTQYGNFDAIIACEVIEHVLEESLPSFFASLAAALKPGGRAIFSVPNSEDLDRAMVYSPFGDILFHRWQHIRGFSSSELDTFLRRHGFEADVLYEVDLASAQHGRSPDLEELLGSVSSCVRPNARNLIAIAHRTGDPIVLPRVLSDFERLIGAPSKSTGVATPKVQFLGKRFFETLELVANNAVSVEQYSFQLELSSRFAAGDDETCLDRSMLRLFEDGKELGPAHSAHADIARLGGGRFSHWGRNLMFSSSDGQDPRHNGRRYVAIAEAAPVRTANLDERLRAGATSMLVWELPPDAIQVTDGQRCRIALPRTFAAGDDEHHPARSALELFEDGVPLGPAHALHEEIEKLGEGRFSHWGRNLMFSSSDGQDPRHNGRRYVAIAEAAPVRTANLDERLRAGATSMLVWELPPDAIQVTDGQRCRIALPRTFAAGDDEHHPARSALELFEDGVPLGPAHALHEEIEKLGEGRFSHWGRNLMFSSSDGQDPRHNGRRYVAIAEAAPVRTANLDERLRAGATSMLVWELPPDAIQVTDGQRCRIALPRTFAAGDDEHHPARSALELFEDGVPLGPAHALHEEIEKLGEGRFSHWGRNLMFSSSDGQDPRHNGRRYVAIAEAAPVRTANLDERLRAGATSMLVWELPPDAIQVTDGQRCRIALPRTFAAGDDEHHPARSALELFEDGVPLGPAHALHEEIEKLGEGRFSHWGRNLMFSSSDGQDPRHNGRRYVAIAEAAPVRTANLDERLRAGATSMLVWELPPDAIQVTDGQRCRIALPRTFAAGDDEHHPARSALELFEDGVPLGPAHALHEEIEKLGEGRFSHWGRNLMFSSSDGQDPRHNGRRYVAIAEAAPVRTANLDERLRAGATSMLVWELPPDAIQVTDGQRCRIALPRTFAAGDDEHHPARSALELFEDGVPLGPAHALHEEIEKLGEGRFSHWGRNLMFSSSDGQDPRHNGRRYVAIASLFRERSKLGHLQQVALRSIGRAALPVARTVLPRSIKARLSARTLARELARSGERTSDDRRRSLSDFQPAFLQSTFTSGPIVHCNNALAWGGVERQVVNTLRGLAKLDGSAPHLLCVRLGYGSDYDFYKAALADFPGRIRNVIDIKSARSYLARNCPELERRIQEATAWLPVDVQDEILRFAGDFAQLRPSVVHIWQDALSISAGFAARMIGVPRIIVSSRNMAAKHFAYYRPYMADGYREIARCAEIVMLNNSEAGARDYARWLGLPFDRYRIIRNGIDATVISPPPEETVRKFRASLGLVEGRPVIGSIFRFYPEKRPLLWIETAERIAAQRPDCQFVVFGTGPMKDEVFAYAQKYGFADRLYMPGTVASAALGLSIMDLFLLTSEFEGTPNVVLEASLLGVPVVAADAGGTRETIDEGVTGFVGNSAVPDDLAEKAIRVLADGAWCCRVRETGPRFVLERFGIDRMLAETLDVYDINKH